MNKHQPQAFMNNAQLEVRKQNYQTPTLERHSFLKITGFSLPIGTLSIPNQLDSMDLFNPDLELK
jgi:hypothetical protein